MAKAKFKRWRGHFYVAKADFTPQPYKVGSFSRFGPTFQKGVSYYEADIYDRLVRSLKQENSNLSHDQALIIADGILEKVPNHWFETRIKFNQVGYTNSRPRMIAEDINNPDQKYTFSWSDFWAIFDKIEFGELEGVFTWKKHGAFVSTRMITDPDEHQAIADGTW